MSRTTSLAAGRCRPLLLAAPLAVSGILLAGCDDAAEQTPAASGPAPAVTVVEVEPRDVTPSTEFVGRVVAIDTVDLRARVQGFLEQRLFTEGQDVEKGDLLFVIEQPPFQAQLAEAKAQVARAEASVTEADATLERMQQAVQSGAVSAQEVDQAQANSQRAKAEVLAGKAQVEIAQLNLGYTEIHAPIGGRIGLSTYTVGNLVGPDTGVLATIVSTDPIYVTFPVSTRAILEVRQRALKANKPAEFVVRAELPDGTMYEHPGKVNFLNIEVDQTTDTITVRAQFPNSDRLLVDGEFVNVTVERDKPEQRLVVPQPAMQLAQGGPYVLIVNSKDQVEQRHIQPGQTYQGNIVVESGLQAGDRVIVEGIQKVRPGQTVQASVVPISSIDTPSGSTPGGDQSGGAPQSQDPSDQPQSSQPQSSQPQSSQSGSGQPQSSPSGSSPSGSSEEQAPAATPAAGQAPAGAADGASAAPAQPSQ